LEELFGQEVNFLDKFKVMLFKFFEFLRRFGVMLGFQFFLKFFLEFEAPVLNFIFSFKEKQFEGSIFCFLVII
jgi:hypothetical protein